MRLALTATLLGTLGYLSVLSGLDAQTAEERRVQVNQHVVGVIAARRGGTMTELAEDLQVALGDDNLRIVPILGRGSIGNIEDLLYLRGVDLALVQSDVLNFYLQQGLESNISSKLRYVASLGPQKAHIVVRRDITSIDQLVGRTMNIGRTNSGSFLSCNLLLADLGIRVEPTNFGHKKALKLLKSGEIDAMFWMGGAPIPGLAGIEETDGLHLLEIPAERIRNDAYSPETLTTDEYPNLVRSPVQTVSVQTVLAAYNWKKGHPRYENVASFKDALVAKQAELQKNDYHPTWQQLDMNADISGWRRFE